MLRACDALPPEFQLLLSNIAVSIEELPPGAVRMDHGILGLYEGTPIGERGTGYTMALPDKITIYRLPLLLSSRSQRELREEVRRTLLHEIGHYFGIGDEDLPY